MEIPAETIECPDCGGSGVKIHYDYDNCEEYPEECNLCLGTGWISEMDWGYFKQDKKDSLKEDETKD